MTAERLPEKFSTIPIFWIAGAFSLGIAVASLFSLPSPWLIAIAGVAGAAAVTIRTNPIAALLIFVGFISAGSLAHRLEIESVAPDRIKLLYDSGVIASGDPVEVEGGVRGAPELTPDGYVLTLNVTKLTSRRLERSASGRVRLFLNGTEQPPLQHGTVIRVPTVLHREEAYLNPGVESRLAILDRMSIDATGVIKSPLLIEVVGEQSIFLPYAFILEQRSRIIREFRENLSPQASAVMIASLLGNDHFLDKPTADLFRESGTYHILVISGLHITFIGGFVLWIVMMCTRRRPIQFIVVTSVLWAYSFAVGAEAPVIRAAITFTIVLAGMLLYRRSDPLNSLGLAALVMLLWRPSQLFDPSFHLTFVSVASIAAIALPLILKLQEIGEWSPSPEKPFPPRVPAWLARTCETFYWNHTAWAIGQRSDVWTGTIDKGPWLSRTAGTTAQFLLRRTVEGIIVSLIVTACMLPLTIVYFHRISLSAIVNNLWIGIVIAVQSALALMGLFASIVSETVATPFYALADAAQNAMLLLPGVLANAPGVSFRLPAYSGNASVIYPLLIAVTMAFAVCLREWKPFGIKTAGHLRRVFNASIVAFLLLGGIAIFHPFSSPGPDGRLRIDFLDVGQGDSAVVTFPNGETMLIDGGGRRNYREAETEGAEPFEPDAPSIGERVVSEFLWHRGFSRVDYLVATHSDADHIDGLKDVAGNFSIRRALAGVAEDTRPDFAEFRSVAASEAIPLELLSAGQRFEIGGAAIEILNPIVDAVTSTNDSSVVLRITYGKRCFLMTGDIEREAERSIVANSNVRCDVVKVPHHGSRTSSTPEFVEAANPEIAVVPVGRRSQFGHPHAEVVDRWLSNGTRVITTGEGGTVTVSTDGKELSISQFRK